MSNTENKKYNAKNFILVFILIAIFIATPSLIASQSSTTLEEQEQKAEEILEENSIKIKEMEIDKEILKLETEKLKLRVESEVKEERKEEETEKKN